VLSRQAKSNGIDADTLARLLLVDPAGLHPLALPGAERAALDRRVRACDRLTQAGAEHKRRIKDLVRQLLPPARWLATSAKPTWPCWMPPAATLTPCFAPAPAGLPG
jgi:hypothetical protein